jgi:hypothetical protein
MVEDADLDVSYLRDVILGNPDECIVDLGIKFLLILSFGCFLASHRCEMFVLNTKLVESVFGRLTDKPDDSRTERLIKCLEQLIVWPTATRV